MATPSEQSNPYPFGRIRPGRFGVYWDGSMICFAVAVPRRITADEAGDIIRSLTVTITQSHDPESLLALEDHIQELAADLRRRATTNMPKGATNNE